MKSGINPSVELDKIECAIKRLREVYANHESILGDPPDDHLLELWAHRASRLSYDLSDFYDARRRIENMRTSDTDREVKGLSPIYAEVPGVARGSQHPVP